MVRRTVSPSTFVTVGWQAESTLSNPASRHWSRSYQEAPFPPLAPRFYDEPGLPADGLPLRRGSSEASGPGRNKSRQDRGQEGEGGVRPVTRHAGLGFLGTRNGTSRVLEVA